MTTTLNSYKFRRNLGKAFMWAILAIMIFITLFPLWWVLRTALTAPKMVYFNIDTILPVQITLDNFLRVTGLMDPQRAIEISGSQSSVNFALAFSNTIIFAGVITISQVFFSAMAAYSFARLQFPLRNFIFGLYVSALMVPVIVTLIPNFILIRNLGWVGTMPGMWAPFFLMTPFAVFYLRQFFLGINREIEEAAKIDGAGPFTTFGRIILPISRAPLATLAMITFITYWNEYLWPLIVGGSQPGTRVMTVALGVFRSQNPSQGAPDWSGLMAASTLAIIPVVLLLFFMGRRILNSIQFSGVK
ncbi:MAG: carbohydrate ABC transporter permease [Anaerolineae bacterium]|nr:carbohydrate ABC transporter permease [Anaerolineae bacterium]